MSDTDLAWGFGLVWFGGEEQGLLLQTAAGEYDALDALRRWKL